MIRAPRRSHAVSNAHSSRHHPKAPAGGLPFNGSPQASAPPFHGSHAPLNGPLRERALMHHGGRDGTWGNLGLWPAQDYAGAATALARVVGEAARLESGQRVLSVGCGAGDELLLWVETYGVALATGVEPDPVLRAAAQALTVRMGPRAQADAPMLAHTLSDALGSSTWDAVVSVDAAYHFSPRTAWLQSAWHSLRPGGRIAFTDLVGGSAGLAPGQRGPLGLQGMASRLTLRLAARAARLDGSDILPLPSALDRLRAAGFVDVGAQRLDTEVLDGFAAFARRQAQALGPAARDPAWRRVAGTARLLPWCRAAGLGYALLWGRRPDGPA